MKDQRTKELGKIRDEIWNLKGSPLYQYRKENNYYPVMGEGSHFAQIVLIGEAPGRKEAETGRPFCGAAGRVLDCLLESVKIKREEVYITNVVKDRPPGNRDPKPEEIELYAPFLIRQLEIIKPKMIVPLGRFSMGFMMRTFGLEEKLQAISRLHGKVFEAKAGWGKIKITLLYHPAVAVYNPNMLATLKKDFQVLREIIAD